MGGSSKKIKERAYMSLVRPKLEYSSCVWDPHTKSQINQIEILVVQRRAACYTCNKIYHNTSSVSNMLDHLQWPTLELRRIQTRLVVFYKIIHQHIAIYPKDLLVKVKEQILLKICIQPWLVELQLKIEKIIHLSLLLSEKLQIDFF